MRVLVTGGAGFIGSQIADAYLEAGHDVAVLDNLSTGLRENLNQDAAFYDVDLTDQEGVIRAMSEFQPEAVNHQAAHLSVSESVEHPQFTAKTNILGFLNLMEAGRKHGLKRVVAASTGGALYGDTDVIPTPETHPTRPVSPYGVSKLSMEQYLHYYNVGYGLEWVTLRYANVYGPRQNPQGETGVIAVFLDRMGTGKQPVIFGDGTQTRDYVYVDDVVQANLAALTNGREAYNIGTGLETDVNTVFEALQQAMGTEFPEQHGDPRPGEQQRSCLDASRARSELGWQPTVSFKEGVAQTVEWFRNHYQPDN